MEPHHEAIQMHNAQMRRYNTRAGIVAGGVAGLMVGVFTIPIYAKAFDKLGFEGLSDWVSSLSEPANWDSISDIVTNLGSCAIWLSPTVIPAAVCGYIVASYMTKKYEERDISGGGFMEY
ncbi:MAG: hypothetical protein KJ601_03320 [Nanoarchaeota archaeon]|nr:hypothetical protein [Nanoarchaeota archaeon]MBU1704865.1 hypothetical protein [Nanoarchaeota archaeon]